MRGFGSSHHLARCRELAPERSEDVLDQSGAIEAKRRSADCEGDRWTLPHAAMPHLNELAFDACWVRVRYPRCSTPDSIRGEFGWAPKSSAITGSWRKVITARPAAARCGSKPEMRALSPDGAL